MTKQRVILTGGGGRIGRAIFERYSEQWDILPLSRVATEGRAALEEWLEAEEAADVVIHCAWSSVPAVAEREPKGFEMRDLPLLRRMMAKLQRASAPPLLVFLSTGAVYGPAPGRPSREEDGPEPIGMYARGKLRAEQCLLESGLPVCILRTGNVYALASSPTDAQGVLGHLIRAGVERRTFEQWGADSVKDYLHREDFLEALGLAIGRRLQGVWNLGSGEGTALSKLVQMVEREIGHPLPIRQKPHPAWDVTDNRLDTTKLRRVLQWRPVIPLDEGVAREVARFAK